MTHEAVVTGGLLFKISEAEDASLRAALEAGTLDAPGRPTLFETTERSEAGRSSRVHTPFADLES